MGVLTRLSEAVGTPAVRTRPRAGTTSRRALRLVVLCAATLCHAFRDVQAQPAGEYQVKAAFVFNFAKFVTWPDSVFASAGTPFVVCVVGQDPFGQILDQVTQGETVDGRPIVVQRLARTSPALTACQIAFVSASERETVREVLNAVNGRTVLTVADFEGFAAAGGIIGLVTEKARIRFEINMDAVERAKLRVSSRLLSLARLVGDRGAPAGRQD